MKLIITIDTDNDAFTEKLDHELGAILTHCYDAIFDYEPGFWNILLRDTNGNTCGQMKYTEE